MAELVLPSFVEAYLTRDDWGGGPVKATWLGLDAFNQWYLHHAVGAMRDYDRDGFLNGDLDDVRRYMQQLQKARPDLGSEVPYSALLFPGTRPDTCVLAEGRGPGYKGAHTAGQNSHALAWAVAGNTDDGTPITDGMIAGARWLAWSWLKHPERALPTLGHRQAPPYYDSKGNNLSATGCPGDQGISKLPLLQPPFLAPTSAEIIPTTSRSTDMHYVVRANNRKVLYDLDENGQLVNTWETVPGSGVLDRGPEVVVPGRWRSMSQPLQFNDGRAERIDLISDSSMGEFAGIRTAIFQPTFEGPWVVHNADKLDAYLASIPKG